MAKTNAARRRRRPLFLSRMRTDERGSVAVEAAIITPVFLLVVIAVIEFGLAFKDQLSITSAVRSGARIASAEPRFSSFATDAASAVAKEGAAIDMSDVLALWVYQADGSGHPVGAGGGFGSCSSNCVQFRWDAGAKKFVQSSGSWTATAINACQGTQDSVGVYMQFRHNSVTKSFFDWLGLSSYTVMRFEPIPTLQSGGCK